MSYYDDYDPDSYPDEEEYAEGGDGGADGDAASAERPQPALNPQFTTEAKHFKVEPGHTIRLPCMVDRLGEVMAKLLFSILYIIMGTFLPPICTSRLVSLPLSLTTIIKVSHTYLNADFPLLFSAHMPNATQRSSKQTT